MVYLRDAGYAAPPMLNMLVLGLRTYRVRSSIFYGYHKLGDERWRSKLDQETEIALLKQEVTFLKSEVSSIKDDVKLKFDRLEKKLDEALKGRPTWATLTMISGLLTITTGLAVYVVTH